MTRYDAIVGLLNSRSSQGSRRYEAAAERVAADARAGGPLQQYMLAVLAGNAALPPAAQIDEETRQRYLEGTRGKIRQLAETRGNALALYLLSMETNDIGLLKRAADGGNPQALNAYGTYLVDRAMAAAPSGTNDVASLLREGFERFRLAAEKDDANGLYNLGLCRLHAWGCSRDEKLAFDSLRRAAALGHPDAMEDLAACYEKGVGTPASATASIRWGMKARAERGDRAAAEWLASNPLPEDD